MVNFYNFVVMPQIQTYNLSPNDVANWFLCNIDREAGDSITHLKLQKLLYYAQAWSLVLKGKSLFEEDFEAWAHGPVLPSIFEQYKNMGFQALSYCECDNNVNEKYRKFYLKCNKSMEKKLLNSWKTLHIKKALG